MAFSHKRTHGYTGCPSNLAAHPPPHTPPLSHKARYRTYMMGQEPDRTPIAPPTPWLSQTHTWIHRVYQEPGSTPSTTHTTAYLQSNAWSTHGVQEHDRASGGAATHGCGHHCGFVCGTCCGNDCVHFCRFVGWSCCGTCRDHFGKQANSPANVPQRTPHPVRLELLLFA